MISVSLRTRSSSVGITLYFERPSVSDNSSDFPLPFLFVVGTFFMNATIGQILLRHQLMYRQEEQENAWSWVVGWSNLFVRSKRRVWSTCLKRCCVLVMFSKLQSTGVSIFSICRNFAGSCWVPSACVKYWKDVKSIIKLFLDRILFSRIIFPWGEILFVIILLLWVATVGSLLAITVSQLVNSATMTIMNATPSIRSIGKQLAWLLYL